MASSSRGRYNPVFEPSTTPSYVDPPPKATIVNPLEIDSQYSNNPEIQPFEYEPSKVVSKSPAFLGQHSRSYGTILFIGDAILSLLPILFIILAFRALAVNGKPLSDAGHTVVQAAKLGPTAFPIIFAAVVGRLMRTYALWKAERGTRLGVLEQLVGSQNLLASIERVFVLRNWTILGLSVLLLWALSPLGGQSALRVLGTRDSGGPGTQRVYYFNTTNDGPNYSSFVGADAIFTNGAAMSALYTASLLAPTDVQTSSTDLWNNPKVPFIEGLSSYSFDSNEWLEVPDVVNTSYSSLSGIMLANLASDHTSNFSIETSYFHLDCTEPRFFEIDDTANFTTNPDKFYGGFLEWLGNVYLTPNKTQNVFGYNQSSSGPFEWSSFMVDTNWNFRTGNPLKAPINLIYASQGAAATEVAAFNCTVGQTRVEANMICSGTSGRECRVGRIRRSLVDRTPNTTTDLNSGDSVYASSLLSSKLVSERPEDCASQAWTWMLCQAAFQGRSSSDTLVVPDTSTQTYMINFLSWFVSAAGVSHSATLSPTDIYLSGSNSPYQTVEPGTFGYEARPYQGMTAQKFSMRFSRLLNTVWQASMATSSIAQTPSSNLTALANSDLGYNTANTTADTILFTEVYDADKVWLALTLIISFILLACGIAGMAFKYMTSAPDILGYVSTMTRDNPYFQVMGSTEMRTEEGDEGSDIGVLGGMRNRMAGKRRNTASNVRSGDQLDGLERARLLRNTRVQISNVKPWSEGGHVALRSVEG